MSWYENLYNNFFGPTYNQYLTGLPDADYQILMKLDIKNLREVCLTNKYTYNLCNNKQFWIEKIKHDGLILSNNIYKLHDTNWLKVYDVSEIITHTIKSKLIKVYIIQEKNNKLLYLLDNYNIVYDESNLLFLDYMEYYDHNELTFIGIGQDDEEDLLGKNYVHIDTFIDILFDAYMENIIKNIMHKNI